MPITMTPQDYADKWARRTSAATQDYAKGINAVTEAPGIKAAAKAEKLLASLMEMINSGKWARRVAGVSLQDWKNAAINKGQGRIAAGVENAKTDMTKFATELLAFEKTVQAEVEAMPDTDLEARILRANHFMRRMAEFERAS